MYKKNFRSSVLMVAALLITSIVMAGTAQRSTASGQSARAVES